MKSGITRTVFLLGSFAFKFPSLKYGHVNFLNGCLANWKERKYYKDFNGAVYDDNMVEFVAPSLFCSVFGLVQIQKKCQPYNFDLTEDQKIFFKPLCGQDNKSENFGIYNNKLVCLDYA